MCVCACTHVLVSMSVVHVEVKKQLEKLVLTISFCVGPGHQTQVSSLHSQWLYLLIHLFSPVILSLVPLGLGGVACAVGVSDMMGKAGTFSVLCSHRPQHRPGADQS